MDIPKTSEAKRKTNARWNQQNMTTLGCSVKKEDATAFKEYATEQGKTAHTLLKEYVIGCISTGSTGEREGTT